MPASLDLLRHLRVTYGAAFAEQVAAALHPERDEARKILAGERAPLSSPGGNLGEKRTDFEVKHGNAARMVGIGGMPPLHPAPHLVSSAEPCQFDSSVRMLDHGHARMYVRQTEGQGH